ncbi:MAG: ABC transporter ATP-binding protein [Kangiellaceae bacterium]|jgi:ABC-2 type transport system ATP-binding protein|nr:ABC transporter ATP-binding protein [Kangiellaceae bacterium]
MTHALIVNHLTKSFGSLIAVDDLSFSVNQGTCFGLLGPNGAGKTTTLEIIESINSADSGEVIYPLKPDNQSLNQHIGIQFQETALQDFIKVEETLVMFADLYGAHHRIAELIELCSLKDYLKQDTKKLSGGQRQRLLLALALLHDPDVIFLDEPTTGLDPQSRRNFWALVNAIKQKGKTLILTTHYMDEAEQLCDEIIIVDKGKIIAQGDPRSLINQHFDGTIIQLPSTQITDQLSELFDNIISSDEGLEIVSKDVDKDLKTLINSDISLEQLNIHKPNLEDLFIKLTGHELRG